MRRSSFGETDILDDFLCFLFTFNATNITVNGSRSVARFPIDTLGRDRLANVVFKLAAFRLFKLFF
jgi:hypothetical protein